jgi:dihydroorotase-like cyclic amidohydrolase
MLRLNGVIDPHVHLRDLDWSHKATFISETAAAIAGGYWAVLDMPNTAPSTVTRARLDHKLDRIRQTALCDWGVYFGASQTGNWDEFETTAPDVCGLKIYNNATTGDLLIDDQALREQIYAYWPAERVIAVHAEGETVPDILDLVRKHGKFTHFCHISTAEEIRYLTEAKQEGLPISIGVTPHHLYLSQEDVGRLGPYAQMKPDLKTEADCAALWTAVAVGVVDVIESDHAPHTIAEKDSDNPPFGVPGLETTLPLLWLAAHEGRISEEQFTALVTTNPQRIFGVTPDAGTYTLFDLDVSYTIDAEALHTACGWTPFDGMNGYGKVREVWIRGEQVYDGEAVLVKAGFGQNLFGEAGA